MIAISNVTDLIAINENPSLKYYLTNDIYLDGMLWSPINNFSGILDGCGYTIQDFIINTTSASQMGFIINNNGTIKNLKISNARYTVSTSQLMNVMYSLFVCTNNGIIDNVTILDSQFNVTYSLNYHDIYEDLTRTLYVSAFAGINKGTISNSKNYVDMNVKISSRGRQTLTSYIGSIAGLNSGNIENCYSEFKMTNYNTGSNYGNTNAGTTSIYINLGGLIGSNTGIVSKSTANINLESTTNKDSQSTIYYTRIGGFIGNNSGEISESISYGSLFTYIPATD